jgi:hypothetical protein
MERDGEVTRIYRMLETSPPAWYAPSAYVEHALLDLPEGVPLVEALEEIVAGLLDDHRGSLGRLNREAIVDALAHIRRVASG